MRIRMRLLLGTLIGLALAMVVGLMPGMSLTAYADVTQEGSNKYVGYRHDDSGFIVYGKREKADGTIEEIQTTCGNWGYKTVMNVGESGSIPFNGFSYGKEYISNGVKASVTASVRGKGVLVTYTLFNDTDEPKTVQIGSYADTQIYADDKAPCSFTENGIKMTSVDGTLEFQLIPGGGNFTTRWYGYYYQAYDNVFNNRTDTSTFTDDSGIAWSWKIEDIPAGATVIKTAELSAGEAGTTQIIYDANGGTGEMDPTVDIPEEQIKLNKNTFTKDDYVFQGWDTNSAGTTVVYADEATLTMPDTDTTLYAVWKENTEITAAAEGFEGAYDGKEHGITVTVTDPSSGATIKYGKTAGTYDLDASPTITNVVDSPLTVYFKVTADGYKDYTGSATVTINKANSTVTKAPEAKTLTYNGQAQALVTAGEATGGTMWYALGENATTAPADNLYTTSIPTATDAGTYYVWYKVVGDENHNDTEPQKVTSTIAKKDEPAPKPQPEPTPGALALSGAGHVQTYGDEGATEETDGILIGTTGQSKRLEQFSVSLPEGTDGGIEYRGHLQGIGWDGWVADGAPCGTTGQSRRIEAVQMTLTGAVADGYSVWYRVHSQTYGWLGWARDGQAAGTAGQSKRAEAIEVQVLPDGQTPSDYAEGQASYIGAATADVHLQGTGWTGSGSALEFGTTGQSRRLEAISITTPNQPEAGGISYEVHAQGIGWMGEVADGALAGTTGQSRRLEAVRVSLTGDMAADFSVWYRVHSQTYGWLGWAHDGQEAGTTGLSRRAEAIDVQILPAGQYPDGYDGSVACIMG